MALEDSGGGKMRRVLRARTCMLIRAFWRRKVLLVPFAVVLPFALIHFGLFLQLAGSALLLPVALFLHEWVHLLLIPPEVPVRVVNGPIAIGVDFDARISAGRGLLIALAPHLLLWGMAIWLWRPYLLLALPFALAGLSLLQDLLAWYQRSYVYG